MPRTPDTPDLFVRSWSIDLTRPAEEVQAEVAAMFDEIDELGLLPGRPYDADEPETRL